MRFARAAFASVALVVACSGGSSTPSDPYPSCSNGKYVLDDPSVTTNAFDAKACREFMKAISTIQTDNAKAPTVITPLAGAVLPAAPPAKVTWTQGTLAFNEGPIAPSIWEQLKGELVLERTAHADDGGTAEGGASTGLTGDAYVVIFRSTVTDGGTGEVLRGMTTNLEFTPGDTGWAALQAAGSLEVSVYGMHFENGKITAGPLTTSQPRTFSITQ